MTTLYVVPLDTEPQCIDNHLNQITLDYNRMELRLILFILLFRKLVLSHMSILLDLIDHRVRMLQRTFPRLNLLFHLLANLLLKLGKSFIVLSILLFVRLACHVVVLVYVEEANFQRYRGLLNLEKLVDIHSLDFFFHRLLGFLQLS